MPAGSGIVEGQPRKGLRVAQVLLKPTEVSETFLRANAERLDAAVTVIHGLIPAIASAPVLSQHPIASALRKIHRAINGWPWQREITTGYLTAFRRMQAQVVLAEFGPAGVRVLEACRIAELPLVVHFHGYDASVASCLSAHSDGYRDLFAYATAVVGVSRAMVERLVALGAPREIVHYRPYGVDCDRFSHAKPADAAPTFLAVGRFVRKKAPDLTLRAFAKVHRQRGDARLRMIGTGPLLEECQALSRQLDVEEAVKFDGARPHEAVAEALQHARAFVQHSIVAPNGDSEGTPNTVLEAASCGLPVVATRHGGIPDVVEHGVTGFLVEEGDVDEMAQHMVSLVDSPPLAAKLGTAGRQRILSEFRMDLSMRKLLTILERAAGAN